MNFPSTITIGGVDYTLYDESQPNKLVYHGAGHTDRVRQKLEIIRTAPTRSGWTMSKRRLLVRLTRDVETDLLGPDAIGTSIEPMVEYFSSNIPGAYKSASDVDSAEDFMSAMAGLTAGTLMTAAVTGKF